MAMRLIRGVMIHMASFIVDLFNTSARFSFLLLSLCGILYSTAGHAVFTIPGQFSVGGDGSASYNIPIQVPPGTAGMAPKLSLTYSSSGGNGILGMGWGIDGLSQISRCPTTLIQDGKINGVNYTATDRFCIDGQRLIATTDTYNATTKTYSTTAAYGANLTEYKTELANFAKIISYGTAGTGPAYFKVWTKGGQIIEYGNTTDSRIEAAGIATARTWGVNKISDTKGNYMTITYTEDNPNGEAYVNRIDYTGNATSAPVLATYASVQFTYEARPDPSIGYQAGSIIKSTKRMTNVKTFNGTALVKDYKLTYEQSYYVKRSLLKTLTECDGGATAPKCNQSITMGWTADITGMHTPQTQATGVGVGAVGSWLIDVNGDGKDDFVTKNNDGNIYWNLSTGTGWGVARSQTGMHGAGGYLSAFADINGDNLPDYVAKNNDANIHWNLSTGTGWGVAQSQATGVGAGTIGGWFADVNGDGRSDFVTKNNDANVYWNLSTGSGWGEAKSQGGMCGAGGVRWLQDINGDGLADYVAKNTDGSICWNLSTGTGWEAPRSQTGMHGIGTHESWLADINGDGLPDYVIKNNDSNIHWNLSTGTGWGAAQSQAGMCGAGEVRWLQDVSGDGLADYIVRYSNNELCVNVSTGTGWSPAAQMATVSAKGSYGTWLADINGDGFPDYVTKNNDSNIQWYLADRWYESWNTKAYLLKTIDHGFGSVTTVYYKPITDATIYTKDSGANAAVYPIQDVQAPVHVVSSYTASDGLGSSFIVDYSYGGLKAQLNGRGSLGFRYAREAKSYLAYVDVTFYRQDYPYIGLPLQTERRISSSNVLVGASQLTYANTDLTTGTMVSKFPYLSQSVEQTFEAGTLINTTTTTNQYDNYGNATQISVNSGDGYIKTTNNVYANDTTNWFLGRLLRSTVTSTAPDNVGTTNSSTPSSGTGLTGSYYATSDLTGSIVLQRVEAIDFLWGTGAPAVAVPADYFSVRWTGSLEATTAGAYQIQTNTDDGIRVTVNGQLLINNWTPHAPTLDTSAVINLTAGQRVPIVVEYQEITSAATMQLFWKTPAASSYSIIPAAQLYGQ